MQEILIKIPDEIYKKYMDDRTHVTDVLHAVRHGTVLPKGHQDLIDRIEVIKSLFDYVNGKKTIGQCIDDVQAIIEADKGE